MRVQLHQGSSERPGNGASHGAVVAAMTHHCLDCPATRAGILHGLVGESSESCQFESLAVEPRETVPLKWFGRFALGIVRRGLLIRQRTDARGRVTAVDVVGPGGLFPVEHQRNGAQDGSMAAGYAATRTLICLCEPESVNAGLVAGGDTAVDLSKLYLDALYRMERLADARARPNTDSRVAALLCALVDTLTPSAEPTARVPAGFLQRDLAALLSMRHESVCRVLRAFADNGLISRDAEGIQLLDRAQLAAV